MWIKRNVSEATLMWTPKEGKEWGVLMGQLKKIIEKKYNTEIGDFQALQKWSTDHISEFWSEIWDFSGVICSKKYDKVIDDDEPINKCPKWFEGARLNYAENLLKYRDDHVALILTGEDREPERVTYAEMYEEVRIYAAAFRQSGLKINDIVACYMSNRKEAIFAMAAAASIGAIWTGALPFAGTTAVLGRFTRLKPKFLLTVDRFQYTGEEIDMLSKVKSIAEGLPSLIRVIIIPTKPPLKDISEIKNSCYLEDFLQTGVADDGTVPPLKFEQVPFSHPLLINFTSGTTGVPKGIIHHFGFLFGQLNTWLLHQDAGKDSIHLSVLPAGSTGFNIHTSLLFIGCTVVLFEGDQFYRSPTQYWDLVDQFQVTHGYINAKTLLDYQKRGYGPTEKHSLASLKVLMSGATIVTPMAWDFVYEKVKKDVVFGVLYGCTEVGVCMLVETTLPVYRGEIATPTLGSDVQIVDEKGNSKIGEIGEVIIAKPTPTLALGLWGDTDGSIFYNDYFSKFPGKLTLSDYGIRNPDTGGFEIICRSDTAMCQAEYRFSSAEICSIVETFPEVMDSLCVSHYSLDMLERIVLFLKMREGHALDAQLADEIRAAIEKSFTKFHVPHFILETKDIPYNSLGKKMEIVVKRIINQMPYSPDAVTNKESLENFFNIPELQK